MGDLIKRKNFQKGIDKVEWIWYNNNVRKTPKTKGELL